MPKVSSKKIRLILPFENQPKQGKFPGIVPWSKGHPGWHIEYFVMATEILKSTIEVHGGGADLEFPHPTNEIAQPEAKTGQSFANYWMHNGFVNVNEEKCLNPLATL